MASRGSALKRDVTVEHATEAWFRDKTTGKLIQLPIAALPSAVIQTESEDQEDLAQVVAFWALGRRR